MSSDESVSDSDASYHEETDDSDSESEYSSLESDLCESDSDEPITLASGWQRISDVFTDSRPTAEPPLLQAFVGVNPTVDISQNSSVLECVKKFISGEIVGHIVACTNERAKHFFEENPSLKGKINSIKWKDVTEHDIYAFLALYFYTGQCRYSEMNQYWAR